MTTFEYLKELCERKGISIHKLEMELGFSNGSLSKANTIPLKRAALIADYFGITIEQVWNKEFPEDTFDPVSGYPVYPEETKPLNLSVATVETGMFPKRSVTVSVEKPKIISKEDEEAKRLYDLYLQAPPEIQAAVETMLKSQLRDS
jgi:lambda repressor-like predicted transcriptional regulator